MKIDRYNNYIKESVHNIHKISLETISEYLTEMTDTGYYIKVSNIFVSGNSKSTKEIESKISYPVLEISINQKAGGEDKPYQMNGSISYKDINTLNLFQRCLRRLSNNFTEYEILWNLRGCDFEIRIVDTPIINEDQFDKEEFSKYITYEIFSSLSTFSNILKDNYLSLENNYNHGKSIGFHLSPRIMREDVPNYIKDGDNKSQFNQAIEKINEIIKDYQSHVKVEYKFNQHGERINVVNKKMKVFKTRMGSFQIYHLHVKIEY